MSKSKKEKKDLKEEKKRTKKQLKYIKKQNKQIAKKYKKYIKRQKKKEKNLASLNAINSNLTSIIEKSQEAVGKIDTKTNLRVFFTVFVILGIAIALLISIGIAWIMNYFLGEYVQISEVWWVLIFSVLFGWVLAVIVGQFFLNPFIKLGLAMKRVAKGDFGIRLRSKSVFKLIKEVYGSFNLMTEELGMTEIVQTDFVSNVSHEFKTPINAIEGYATLLQGGGQSDAEREVYVEKILLNTERLSELVSNILLISKIENQAIQTPSVSFRLDEQIRGAIVDLEAKWGKKNIEFDVDLDFVDYVGNQSLLRHVWDNLIDNAVKFSPEGSEIKIRLGAKGGRVIFSIADRGCGIDEKAKEHIFDKFFQGDSSHKGEGNGLGLSLVKKIVDIHGGDVAVENRTDGGCCFEISLPIKEI